MTSVTTLPRTQNATPRFSSSYFLSALLHVLFLFTLYLQQVRHAQEDTTKEYDLMIVTTPIEAPASNLGGTLPAPSAPKRPSAFAGLLAQASKGVQPIAKAGKLNHAKDSAADQAAMAQNIKSDLVQSGQVQSGLAQLLKARQLRTQGINWNAVGIGDASGVNGEKPMTDKELELIREILGKRQIVFRNCYERALLSDEKLSGKVDFLFTIAAGGRVGQTQVQFQGNGNSSSQSLLKSCLGEVSQAIQFPSSISGRRIKFNLRVKS